MDRGKTADITLGKNWDLECQVVYVPYYDRLDDWRNCAWNPMKLVEVDIIDITVLLEHQNSTIADQWITIDYDNLSGKHQEKLIEKVMNWEEWKGEN
jgi:hypothetical protein